MKSLLSFGILFFALTFCGIGERLRQVGGSNTSSSGNSNTGSPKTTSGDTDAEKPTVTSSQLPSSIH